MSRFTIEVGNKVVDEGWGKKEENMCWKTDRQQCKLFLNQGLVIKVWNLHAHLWGGCSLYHVFYSFYNIFLPSSPL